MASAERTLVKSPPELWELVDDPALMSRWCASLLGLSDTPPVDVTLRETGERIAWRSAHGAAAVHLDLTFSEKGWGTSVSITASCQDGGGGDLDATLNALLDELASPQRRPFTRA